MERIKKFKWGTEGFHAKGKLVRTRPSQVIQRRKMGGSFSPGLPTVMPRKQAADRLKAYRKDYGKKAALQIKRTSRKDTGY